ncbi:MAG: DUF1992 domain-containing protein [Sciscionella sp.]
MTERKPAGVQFGSWVDRQIGEAQDRGEFDDLPGFGKPIPNSGRPDTAYDTAAAMAKRAGIDTASLLPPSLALAKEVEELPTRLAAERSEIRVREIVLDLNDRIRTEACKPQAGPRMRARPVEVEDAVRAWRHRSTAG